tara:strand:- start:785 stop:1102 length:318 start_codon:yes stop_codon:yes gene_type:complete
MARRHGPLRGFPQGTSPQEPLGNDTVDFDGIRRGGDADFGKDASVYEVRMGNGVAATGRKDDAEAITCPRRNPTTRADQARRSGLPPTRQDTLPPRQGRPTLETQ